MKKKDMLENTTKEMERLHFSENLIDNYKNKNIMVSDLIENKMYNVEENHKIREAAGGVQFMSEHDVFHVIRMDTPDLGKAVIFLLSPNEIDKVDLVENECHVYRYFPENVLYCGFGVAKLNVNDNIVSLASEYA